MKTKGKNHSEDIESSVDKNRAVHMPGPLHMLCCWTRSHLILVLSDYGTLTQWMGVRNLSIPRLKKDPEQW